MPVNFEQDGETKDGTDSANEDLSKVREERREFLKRCGKYAIYVAPIVASLLLPNERLYAVSTTT